MLWRVQETPEVTGTAATSRVAFGVARDAPYMPHLSFIYGDLTDAQRDEVTMLARSSFITKKEISSLSTVFQPE